MGKRTIGLTLAAIFILYAAPVLSQTVVNPRTAQFDPSADHNAVTTSGQPVLVRYELAIYPAGVAQAQYVVDLGKPAPDPDGKIRVDFASRLPTWPLANGIYEARVSAVGASGTAPSDPSNQFAFQSCSYGVTPLTRSVGAAGGTTTVAVTDGAGCGWTATSNASWLSVSPASGTGAATVSLTLAANPGPALRTGTATIAGQTVTVSQDTVVCAYSLGSTGQSLTAAGGSGTVTLTTIAGCGWTATSGATWATVTPASGSGPGTVSFAVAANPNTYARTATMLIGGQTFTVTQDAAACTVALGSSSQNVAAAGGNGSISVTSPGGCSWTATSSATWVTVTPATGSGSGSASFVVTANSSTAARTATLTIGGQPFTVSQDALACTFTLGSSSQNVAAAGGNGSVSVSSPGGCSWTAASNATWVTVAPATGSGPGTVNFTVTANSTAAARTATLSIGGRPFTVTQDAAPSCTFALGSSSQTVAAAGGNGSISVSSPGGCSWTASSGASWVTVSPSVSSGSGSVTFQVASNPEASSRAATLTVAGQTFTVMQEAASCTSSLGSLALRVGPAASSNSVSVSSPGGCSWTAASGVSWVTVTPSGGSGAGSVTLAVAANNTNSARTGIVTIAGIGVSVNQDASGRPQAPRGLKIGPKKK